MKQRIIFPTSVSSLSSLNRWLRGSRYKDSRFFILVDENSYTNCLPEVISKCSALQEAEFFEVPVSEEAKTLEVASQLWAALIESGADRNSVIINLGGGCISDIGGFVAAGFKRGIRYVNVPTTLVGMIDAAIGGKTAVNIGTVKNQVGFFHQPDAICINPVFLDTLPDIEIVSGLFEMVKTLMLSDVDALKGLFSAIDTSRGLPMDKIKELVRQCVDFKSAVTKTDPQDCSVRKILNFGHTFGHAIESFMMESGTPLSHGAAVGIGMKCELYLSAKKLGMSEKILESFGNLLARFVIIPKYSLKDTERILYYMRQDKKNRDELILCVLLQELGAPVIDVAINENEVRDALLQVGKK